MAVLFVAGVTPTPHNDEAKRQKRRPTAPNEQRLIGFKTEIQKRKPDKSAHGPCEIWDCVKRTPGTLVEVADLQCETGVSRNQIPVTLCIVHKRHVQNLTSFSNARVNDHKAIEQRRGE